MKIMSMKIQCGSSKRGGGDIGDRNNQQKAKRNIMKMTANVCM